MGVNMKKIILILIMLFSVELLSAKSDIQLSAPLVSLFNKWDISSESYNYNYGTFFTSGDSLYRAVNQNYFNDRFGFYESVSICIPNFGMIHYWGIKIALGPSIKILNAKYADINLCLGPDILISGQGIIIGSELDFQVKFTPNRRCSPIIGSIINLDFFSTLSIQKQVLIGRTSESYYGNNTYYSTYYYPVYVEEKVQKLFHFYVQPYIAFCVNLY